MRASDDVERRFGRLKKGIEMRLRNWSMGLAIGLLGAVGVPNLVGDAPAGASTTVSGQVACASSDVEGIWVAATSGPAGWATLSHPSGSTISQSWRYTLGSGNSYILHVGCGGSPNNWTMTVYSLKLTGSGHTLTCWDMPYEALYRDCR